MAATIVYISSMLHRLSWTIYYVLNDGHSWLRGKWTKRFRNKKGLLVWWSQRRLSSVGLIWGQFTCFLNQLISTTCTLLQCVTETTQGIIMTELINTRYQRHVPTTSTIQTTMQWSPTLSQYSTYPGLYNGFISTRVTLIAGYRSKLNCSRTTGDGHLLAIIASTWWSQVCVRNSTFTCERKRRWK